MPGTEAREVSHGDVRCDICGTVVLAKTEVRAKDEIKRAIGSHHKSTGHKDYSFYGRVKLEAASG